MPYVVIAHVLLLAEYQPGGRKDCLTIAVASAAYGLFGMFRLGVLTDSMLLAGAGFVLTGQVEKAVGESLDEGRCEPWRR